VTVSVLTFEAAFVQVSRCKQINSDL